MRSENIQQTETIKIAVERIPGLSKVFSEKGKLHYRVRLYLSAPRDILDQISLVTYHLHASFKRRDRFSTDRVSNFETLIWTYGYFPLTATISTRDGNESEIKGFVKFG